MEMVSRNITHLAGEFLVAGELARRGYPVSITMGNAKSVDIYVGTREGVKKVDAKAGRGKTNFPIGKTTHIEQDVYYIFVYLQTASKIKENVAPEYFVISGDQILSQNLVRNWSGGRRGITYGDLKHNYEEKWSLLPPPPKDV